jgi:hypothetical protein
MHTHVIGKGYINVLSQIHRARMARVFLGRRSIKSTRLNGVVYRLIIGSRGACVQFRGKTYDLIYTPRAYPLFAPPGTRCPQA